jgi:hypothetical protein
VSWPRTALRWSTQCGEAWDVPVDFRCNALPTATHTLATVVDGSEGRLGARSEEGGRAVRECRSCMSDWMRIRYAGGVRGPCTLDHVGLSDAVAARRRRLARRQQVEVGRQSLSWTGQWSR